MDMQPSHHLNLGGTFVCVFKMILVTLNSNLVPMNMNCLLFILNLFPKSDISRYRQWNSINSLRVCITLTMC